MKKTTLFLLLIPVLLTRVWAADWKMGDEASANLVESVNVQTLGKTTKIIIQSSKPLAYRDIAQNDPAGVFLYITAAAVCQQPPVKKVFGDLLDEIRFVYKDAQTPADKPLPLEYILFRLKEPARYTVTQKDWVVVLELSPKSLDPTRTQSAQTAAPQMVELAAVGSMPKIPRLRKKPLAVLPPDPILKDFIDVGLSNNVPLQMAIEEHFLARIRYAEAARSMLPAFTGRYENSDGTLILDPQDRTKDTGFRRQELGLQVGQPLFQSGRLYYGLRQAGLQKHISAQGVGKARAEAKFEIVKAYFNLIKSQHAQRARLELTERASRVLDMTRKKIQLELITEAEALGVESQFSQVTYRTLSDEKDLEIARLKMAALLNVPELPDAIPDPAEPFDAKKLMELSVPMGTVVDYALRERPDMLAAEYTARYALYGYKAAWAENNGLRVDASGFIGKSGGAYEHEDLELKRSWNVGMQASMFFMGSSLKGTGSKEKTSPDLGETSRSDNQSRSASLGFLDGLKGIADKRQARINREKGIMERDQKRRDVEVEVREAYYSLQKARIQFAGAQRELDYRQKDMHIARQKEKLNLSEPSQTMQAEISYTEAVVGFEEAIAFYKVSLAQLEKATGAPLETLQSLGGGQ